MLISESIKVELREARAGIKEPAAFTWRGDRYEIEEILLAWTDAGNPARKWYQRRYRNYFRVRTTDENLWELYLERPTPRRTWILAKKLSGDE